MQVNRERHAVIFTADVRLMLILLSYQVSWPTNHRTVCDLTVNRLVWGSFIVVVPGPMNSGRKTLKLRPTILPIESASACHQSAETTKSTCLTHINQVIARCARLSFLSPPWGLWPPTRPLLSSGFLIIHLVALLLSISARCSLVLARGTQVYLRYSSVVAFNLRL
jgi:hypothetical protein